MQRPICDIRLLPAQETAHSIHFQDLTTIAKHLGLTIPKMKKELLKSIENAMYVWDALTLTEQCKLVEEDQLYKQTDELLESLGDSQAQSGTELADLLAGREEEGEEEDEEEERRREEKSEKQKNTGALGEEEQEEEGGVDKNEKTKKNEKKIGEKRKRMIIDEGEEEENVREKENKKKENKKQKQSEEQENEKTKKGERVGEQIEKHRKNKGKAKAKSDDDDEEEETKQRPSKPPVISKAMIGLKTHIQELLNMAPATLSTNHHN